MTTCHSIGTHPFGLASLENRNLKDQQAYDVTVSLTLPRSPPNLELGNFMVTLHLLDAAPSAPTGGVRKAATVLSHLAAHPHVHLEKRTVIASARRPCLIPYSDPLVSLASRVLFIAYHVLFSRTETAALEVPMLERAVFHRPADVPAALFLELEAGQAIQVYGVSVTLTARLAGLRWFMYHYMLTSFLVFTVAFWVAEMIVAALTWFALSALLAPGPDDDELPSTSAAAVEGGGGGGGGAVVRANMSAVKKEAPASGSSDVGGGGATDEYSDAPGSYADVKTEEALRRFSDVPSAGAEADDEDDDDDDNTTLLGSAAGTGTGSNAGEVTRANIRRRTSRTLT